MKEKIQTAAAILIVALLCLGFHATPGLEPIPQSTHSLTWQAGTKTLATLTACNGAPGVTARDYDSLDALPDANCTIVEVDPRASFYEFDCEIDADANTATVLVLGAPYRYDPGSGANRDVMPRFTRLWSWAITGGTQTAPNSNVYADTIVATQYTPSVGVVSDSGGDYICRFDVDCRGLAYLAFLRTDSDPNLTVYVDGRPY